MQLTQPLQKSRPPRTQKVPPPVEQFIVPVGPSASPLFVSADFPMALPGLPSSTASSPATHTGSRDTTFEGPARTCAISKTGCDIPRFIEFRSLPRNVQDDLTRAEILPTMWRRYKIFGYERVSHYRLMTVIRRAKVTQANCHQLTLASLNSMYPPSLDEKYRAWINELIHVPSKQLKRHELPVHPAQVVSVQALCLGQSLHLAPLPLRTPSLMSTTRQLIKSEEHWTSLASSSSRIWNSSWQSGFSPLRTTQTTCSCRVSMPARPAREQVPGLT